MLWKKEEVDLLKELYPINGCDSKIYGKTKSQISTKAGKLKLRVSKSRLQIRRGVPKPKQCNVTASKFITPDKNSSYLLGLLWGDGHLGKVNRISIESMSSDLDEIESIFNTTGKWTKFCRHRDNKQPSTTLQTSNIELYSYLSSNKYEDKSFTSPKLDMFIPKELVYLWWRGYFDADGCIYTNNKHYTTQISICSTYEQDWSFAESLFMELGCKYTICRRIQSKSKHSVIRVTNKEDCLKFLIYIYAGEIFGLSRKYNKYLSLL